MIYLDQDYSRRTRPGQVTLADMLTAECRRKNIPFEVAELNPLGYGDLMFRGLAGIYSAEIKGAAEILGGLDHAEKQLMTQVPSCNRPSLLIYGRVEPTADGNSYSVASGDERQVWERHPDSGHSVTTHRRYFRQNYLGYRTKLARFSAHGIEVFEVPTLETLSTQIMGMYSVATTDGTTFSRLIPEKFVINEPDAARKQFRLQVMGLQAGWGEKLSDVLCDWFKAESSWSPSIYRLIDILTDMPGATDRLSSWPLSGKTIGPVAVARLKDALGC